MALALPFYTAGIALRNPHQPGVRSYHCRAAATITSRFLKKTANNYISSKRLVTRGGLRGVVRCGNVEWENGNARLEEDIFEFMDASEKPDRFPTKQELLRAGRSDLVDAIVEDGGWLAVGWDYSEEPETLHVNHEDADEDSSDDDVDGFIGSVEEEVNHEDADEDSSDDDVDGFIGSVEEEEEDDFASEKPHLQETIDVSAEDVSEKPRSEESGIAAILNGLDRERTLFYSEASPEKKRKRLQQPNEGREYWNIVREMQPLSENGKRKADDISLGLKESQGIAQSLGRETTQPAYESTDLDFRENLFKPKRWGVSNAQHDQMEDLEIEAKGDPGVSLQFWQNSTRIGQQISSQTMHADENGSLVVDKINKVTDKVPEWTLNIKTSYSDHSQEIYSRDVPNTVISRIQKLELQLASTLGFLRSSKDTLDINKDEDNSALQDLEKASDALEFQETEIMKMRAKLRATRAKLVALEGKMAMEIMEVRKAIEEKQKKMDEAQKVLKLLRIARIVWPNSASEVFLAGSFDGWTSHRRMGKSNAGVFVVSLQLYPGRYEIKFIVDGVWRVDTQRPVVYNNGIENNLLLIY